MPKLILKSTLLTIFVLISTTLSAQESKYLADTQKYLDQGDCQSAERAYRLYKNETKTFVLQIEQRISECKNQKPATITISVDNVDFNMMLVTSDFYMGETEVTQELWETIMGNNPSEFKNKLFPVESVTLAECLTFIEHLNQKTGKHFRLPTKEEHIFAMQGADHGNDFIFAGSNNVNDVAWVKYNSNGKTHLVKSKRPNELGLYDMNGNVREWCQDLVYNRDMDRNIAQTSGGSWYDDVDRVKANQFFITNLHDVYPYIGFRLLLEQ